MAINNHNCIKHFYKGSAPCSACVIEESGLQMKAIARAIPGTIGAMLQDDGANKTLRDEFAMAALGGMISVEYGAKVSANQWAKDAYEVADAMLKARKATK